MTSFTVSCSKQEVCIIQLYPSDELLSLCRCQHRRCQKRHLICVPVLCTLKYNYFFFLRTVLLDNDVNPSD